MGSPKGFSLPQINALFNEYYYFYLSPCGHLNANGGTYQIPISVLYILDIASKLCLGKNFNFPSHCRKKFNQNMVFAIIQFSLFVQKNSCLV